jgi:hypothetical protein
MTSGWLFQIQDLSRCMTRAVSGSVQTHIRSLLSLHSGTTIPHTTGAAQEDETLLLVGLSSQVRLSVRPSWICRD